MPTGPLYDSCQHLLWLMKNETTDMIRSHSIDLLYVVAESHGVVDKQLKELVRGRFSRQKLELTVDGGDPGYNYDCGNLWCMLSMGSRRDLQIILTMMAPMGSRSTINGQFHSHPVDNNTDTRRAYYLRRT